MTLMLIFSPSNREKKYVLGCKVLFSGNIDIYQNHYIILVTEACFFKKFNIEYLSVTYAYAFAENGSYETKSFSYVTIGYQRYFCDFKISSKNLVVILIKQDTYQLSNRHTLKYQVIY